MNVSPAVLVVGGIVVAGNALSTGRQFRGAGDGWRAEFFFILNFQPVRLRFQGIAAV